MDPLHQQILDRLAGELDGRVFEDCACDLLRDVYPGLAPVRGGRDAGMDGAIADGEGEAFPLICTTREDFHRNLVESLDSYLASGRRRRKAVFATSQAITPTKRRGLEDAAQERGFALVQIVDRHGMAQRLYRSPRWLRQLLGLSGAPSALSVVPRSRRPLLELVPVGREEDLEWIRSTPGDLVVAGEPGSGKTFLLAHLIRSGWNALFLVDEERGEVKRALLEQRPDAVVVDDAHVRPGALDMLHQMRVEMEAGFSLVATTWTWENDRDRVAAALPDAQIRELRLLPRHQILAIFQQAGVRESDELLRELVDQAANKPGLAATIAHLWKRGAWQEILEGRALHQEVLAAFGNAGEDVEDLLAALSLGGDRGMGLEPVQRFLRLSRPAIRRQAAALAAGGVLGVENGEALSVWPRRLRTSLLRTVFFSGAASRHDLRQLLAEAPNFAEAVQEIAAVRQAGANVPEIRELVLEAGSSEESAIMAWRRLAEAGEEEARWVLEQYPGDLLEIAYVLLEMIPSEVIPRLLDRATEEATAREREGQAMSLLRHWIQERPPDQEEALRRRERLARAAKRFLEEDGDLGTGVHGICLTLTPNQSWSSRDPGLGNTVRHWSALLPLDGLHRIAKLWEEVRDAIPALDRAAWRHVESALWNWMYPSNAAPHAPVPEDAGREMPELALRVLGDLIPLAQTSPGLRSRLARVAAKLHASLPIELDPVFELLYPESYVKSEPADEAARQGALRELAGEWERLGPREMGGRLAWYEAEAERIGYGWPRGSQQLCRLFAERVSEPRPWLEALVDSHLAGTFASPFLERLVRERHSDWEQVAERCLELDAYQFEAVEAILTLPGAPPSLVAKALDRAAAWPVTVDTLAARREIPAETLRAALRHPRWEIALAAAVGEWYAGKKTGVRTEFLAAWREAILKAPADSSRTELQHWLGTILAGDPDLALDWLRARLRDPEPATFFLSGPFASAVEALRYEQRAQLVGEMPAIPIIRFLLPPIVRQEPELYKQLLTVVWLRDYHLAPLAGKPDGPWIELAQLALEAGHPPERIAEAAVWGPGGHFFAGPSVDYWEEWAQAFAALEDHPRAEMREVGSRGRQIIGLDLQRARARQEQINLRGM
jgi:hypothetical protein